MFDQHQLTLRYSGTDYDRKRTPGPDIEDLMMDEPGSGPYITFDSAREFGLVLAAIKQAREDYEPDSR